MKYLLSIAAIAVMLFTGCAQTSNQQSLKVSQEVQKKIKKPLTIGSYRSKSGYYYVLIEKKNNRWEIVDIKDVEIRERQNQQQEILRVDQSYSQVIPNYQFTGYSSGNTYECGYLMTTEKYSPCTSQLTSTSVGKSVAKNIAAAVTTLGLASGSHKYVDQNLINEAVVQTDLFNMIESKKNTFEKILYERLFYEAKTISDYDSFIAKYSLNDEKNFVPIAIKKRDELKIEQKLVEEEKQKKEIEQKRIKEEMDKAIAEASQKAKKERIKEVEYFRETLAVGTTTNCGLIVEMKESLVKVYYPVQNYGNEHWIKRNELFPQHYNCNFFNGKYIAPLY